MERLKQDGLPKAIRIAKKIGETLLPRPTEAKPFVSEHYNKDSYERAS